MSSKKLKILCVVPAADRYRAEQLCNVLDADVTFLIVDRGSGRLQLIKQIRDCITASNWELAYMENTGISAGLNLIYAKLERKLPFIIGAGDPIGGYFCATKNEMLGFAMGIYERILYRFCDGFIGWTPYLTGAALSLGAKRAATVEGAANLNLLTPASLETRQLAKKRLGLDPKHLVLGVVGSLNWSRKQSYCYGLELVEILKRLQRKDVSVLIVGDGNGRAILSGRLPDDLKSRAVFAGRVQRDELPGFFSAIDIGFVTQTLDSLGQFRLTAKLPEFLASGIPVAMSPVPGYFDYVRDAGWALPAMHPATEQFHQACADWLERLTPSEISQRATNARQVAELHFSYELAQVKFRNFVVHVLDQIGLEAKRNG